ncbi:hypothetical protein AB0B50_07610 [Streptomyces sp. NPDC041068]|uniref:hypothetical protein n=1 Tax=Streptomyces sp. NPDC041068 TaxID=3155130 RepID=UPI0033D698C0
MVCVHGIGQQYLGENQLYASWHPALADGLTRAAARTLARTPYAVQRALNALCRSRFFADVALRSLVLDLEQVRAYLTDAAVRAEVQRCAAAAGRPDIHRPLPRRCRNLAPVAAGRTRRPVRAREAARRARWRVTGSSSSPPAAA